MSGPLRSKFKFGKNSYMPDGTSISAELVKIGSGSSIDTVFTNRLRPSVEAEIRGEVLPLGELPVLNPFCTVPEFQCGTEDVVVPASTTQLGLAPGNYGDLLVGDGATLRLTEFGTYTFCSIKIGSFARVEATQQVTINLAGKFQMRQGSFFGTTIGAPLILYSSGNLIRVSQAAVLNAAITAPYAKFKIQRRGELRGCLCSQKFTTDKVVTLICEGGSPSGAFLD